MDTCETSATGLPKAAGQPQAAGRPQAALTWGELKTILLARGYPRAEIEGAFQFQPPSRLTFSGSLALLEGTRDTDLSDMDGPAHPGDCGASNVMHPPQLKWRALFWACVGVLLMLSFVARLAGELVAYLVLPLL